MANPRIRKNIKKIIKGRCFFNPTPFQKQLKLPCLDLQNGSRAL
jgi:hypothetical protein